MFHVLVFLQLLHCFKDAGAIATRMPMFPLLMVQALPLGVSGPSSKTVAAFYLVGVIATIVKVVAHSIVSEAAATAFRHSVGV